MEDLVDKWHGWIVVCCAAFISGSEGGIFKSSGQIFVAIIEGSSFTRTEVATTCLIPKAVSAVVGIIGSKMAEIYSFRMTMFFGTVIATAGFALSSLVTDDLILFNITFGIIVGVGCGLSMTPAMIMSGLYFKKQRAIAICVTNFLASVNPIFIPVLLQYLIDEYKLQGALLLFGGFVLHGCICAMFIRQPVWALKIFTKSSPNPETIELINTSQEEDSDKKLCNFCSLIFSEVVKDLHIFQNVNANLMLFTRIVVFGGMIAVYLILPPFAIEHGVTKTHVAFFLSIISIGDLFARIASGFLLHLFPKWKKTFYFITLSLLALITCAFQFAVNYRTLLVCSLLYGVVLGCINSIYFVVMFDFFPVNQVPSINAFHAAITGFVTMAMGPLTAGLREYSDSYVLCWTVLGVGILLCTLTSLIYTIFFTDKKTCSFS